MITEILTLGMSRGKFISGFPNENLAKQANSVWMQLSLDSVYFFICAILGGIIAACIYYTWYNDRPGRHYTRWHWGKVGIIMSIILLAVTFGVEWGIIKTHLNVSDLWSLYARVALGSTFVGVIAYFLMSVIWCNWLPTNAYRFLKFKKR